MRDVGERREPAEADGDALGRQRGCRCAASRRAGTASSGAGPSSRDVLRHPRACIDGVDVRPHARRGRPRIAVSSGRAGAHVEQQPTQPPAVLGQRAVGVLGGRDGTETEEHRQDVGTTSTSRGSTAPDAGRKTKASPAISAAAFERTPMVTRTASQTTPAKVANSLGWNVVCARASSPPPIPAMRAAERPRDHLHLHDADARRPGAGLAPASRVERQPGGRASEVHDEEREDRRRRPGTGR